MFDLGYPLSVSKQGYRVVNYDRKREEKITYLINLISKLSEADKLYVLIFIEKLIHDPTHQLGDSDD